MTEATGWMMSKLPNLPTTNGKLPTANAFCTHAALPFNLKYHELDPGGVAESSQAVAEAMSPSEIGTKTPGKVRERPQSKERSDPAIIAAPSDQLPTSNG